jgi:hypothetical protein
MSLRALSILAAFLLPGALWAQVTDAYQVRYASNLNIGDSVVNIVNTGALDGYDPAGNICVNIYTFRPDEQPINCCTCYTTPDGLKSISVNGSLNTNSIFPQTQNSLVIKLYATVPAANGTCNAAAPGAPAPGIRAWGTTLHAAPGYTAVTETAFAIVTPAASEITKLTSICSFIQQFGTNNGVCGGCQTGGLATSVQ